MGLTANANDHNVHQLFMQIPGGRSSNLMNSCTFREIKQQQLLGIYVRTCYDKYSTLYLQYTSSMARLIVALLVACIMVQTFARSPFRCTYVHECCDQGHGCGPCFVPPPGDHPVGPIGRQCYCIDNSCQ